LLQYGIGGNILMKKRIALILVLSILMSCISGIIISAKGGGIKSLEETIEQLKLQITDLIYTNSKLSEKNNLLTEANNNLISENEALKAQVNGLIQENQNLSTQLDSVNTDNQRLTSENSLLAEKISNYDLWLNPVNKNDVIGNWQAVGFVDDISNFDYTVEDTSVYLKSLYFTEDTVNISCENEIVHTMNWIDNVVINNDLGTASKFLIKEYQDQKYMFYEWKSDEYTNSGMKPKYFVLKKTASQNGGIWYACTGQSLSPSQSIPAMEKTLTVFYPEGSVIMQYQVNGGEWLDYTGPITFTQNCYVSTRAFNSNNEMATGGIEIAHVGYLPEPNVVYIDFISQTPTANDLGIDTWTAERAGDVIHFTLKYYTGTLRNYSYYNPPDGNIIMQVEYDKLLVGLNTLTFDIPVNQLVGTAGVTMSFWQGSEHDNFISFDLEQIKDLLY
jgi:FtsZ-binding cell division protein ZapB